MGNSQQVVSNCLVHQLFFLGSIPFFQLLLLLYFTLFRLLSYSNLHPPILPFSNSLPHPSGWGGWSELCDAWVQG